VSLSIDGALRLDEPGESREEASGADQPLIVVSSRLPVTWSPEQGWTRSPGGLVTALEGLAMRRRLVWFGHQGSGEAVLPPRWPHAELRPIRIDATTAHDALDGLANRALWPALHGMSERVRWRHEWWDAYQRYNAAFADVLAPTLRPGSRVWVHDYQLLLLPELLRRRVPGVHIGLSLHTPFDLTAMGDLPAAGALAGGMSAARCIGTQTDGDRRAVREFLVGNASPAVPLPALFTSPVSIDTASTRALLDDPRTQLLGERERSSTDGRRLVVSVDRLDYTKGIIERMRGYDEAFRRGWLVPDEVRLVQVTQPTRVRLPEYRSLRIEVERLAHAVNARWRRSDGSFPLETMIESLDRRHVAAFLAAADVCLVTPRRDGMNLVAKEFAVLNEGRNGALVLTAGAGAAAELAHGAIVLDTLSPLSVASAIRDGLTMGQGERARRGAVLADAVGSWTALAWANAFLDQLTPVATEPSPLFATA
jgi:trehalose 6-phosphate synthase/phosphatase